MRSSVTGRSFCSACWQASPCLHSPPRPRRRRRRCQLDGTASFGSGLNTTAKPFDYSFNGTLSNCQSNVAGSPASGTVSAGEVYTDSGSGKQYQLPRSQGNGSCGSSTTSGTAVAFWADGTRTDRHLRHDGRRSGRGPEGSVVDSAT